MTSVSSNALETTRTAQTTTTSPAEQGIKMPATNSSSVLSTVVDSATFSPFTDDVENPGRPRAPRFRQQTSMATISSSGDSKDSPTSVERAGDRQRSSIKRHSSSLKKRSSYESKPEEAVPETPHVSQQGVTRESMSWKMKAMVGASFLFGLNGTVLGIAALIKSSQTTSNTEKSSQGPPTGDACDPTLNEACDPTESNTNAPRSFLEEIHERGFLRCGVGHQQPGFLLETGFDQLTDTKLYAGMDSDLCAAVSAAIFGDFYDEKTSFEIHSFGDENVQWEKLHAKEVDLVMRAAYTMDHDIYVPSVGTGFEFTTNYFFDGVTFGGIPEFVECAESGVFNETCTDLKVCLEEGTKSQEVIQPMIPTDNLVILPPGANSSHSFPTACNVLVGSRSSITQPVMERQNGYTGSYVLASQMYSHDTFSIASREGDTRWSDFVQAVLQALIFAEEQGIRKTSASEMPETELFGSPYELMFQNAVAVRGNFGEIYVHNLEAFVPRNGLNLLNQGKYPRIWSRPFGELTVEGPPLEEVSHTVRAIRNRGFLNCGQVEFLGLTEFVRPTLTYEGFQVDLCRAVAAALFDGQDKSLTTLTTFTNRFQALQEEQFDLLMTSSWTIPRDVKIEQIGKGLSFVHPFFYLGVGFGGRMPYVDCAERSDVFSPECQSLSVCTFAGTTFVTLFSHVLRDHFLTQLSTFDEMVAALSKGDCNVILSSVNQIQEAVVRDAGYSSELPYVVGTRLFSIENASILSREGDPAWTDFLNWIVMALVYAEEQGIDQSNADLMPRTNLFGPSRTNAFFHAVNAVGNYGEVYERNMGLFLPRSGVHLLNDNDQPLLDSLPIN